MSEQQFLRIFSGFLLELQKTKNVSDVERSHLLTLTQDFLKQIIQTPKDQLTQLTLVTKPHDTLSTKTATNDGASAAEKQIYFTETPSDGKLVRSESRTSSKSSQSKVSQPFTITVTNSSGAAKQLVSPRKASVTFAADTPSQQAPSKTAAIAPAAKQQSPPVPQPAQEEDDTAEFEDHEHEGDTEFITEIAVLDAVEPLEETEPAHEHLEEEETAQTGEEEEECDELLEKAPVSPAAASVPSPSRIPVLVSHNSLRIKVSLPKVDSSAPSAPSVAPAPSVNANLMPEPAHAGLTTVALIGRSPRAAPKKKLQIDTANPAVAAPIEINAAPVPVPLASASAVLGVPTVAATESAEKPKAQRSPRSPLSPSGANRNSLTMPMPTQSPRARTRPLPKGAAAFKSEGFSLDTPRESKTSPALSPVNPHGTRFRYSFGGSSSGNPLSPRSSLPIASSSSESAKRALPFMNSGKDKDEISISEVGSPLEFHLGE